MSGFVLGDDPGYADLATQIIHGHYPFLCDTCVFAFRYVLLECIAASLKLFGYSELSFVLPILLSSLACIYLSYELAKHFFDHQTGILAALLLAVFPMDLVNATTLTNDIMLGMMLALSLLLFLKAMERKGRAGMALFALSGVVLAAAVGVKINSLPVIGLLLLIAFYKQRQGEKLNYRGLAVFFAAWILVQSAFCIGYYVKTGDFLAYTHAELNFNNRLNPSGFQNTTASLIAALLYYPNLMMCLAAEGHPGYTFYPYGFFYPVLLLGLMYFSFKGDKKVFIPLLWFGYIFLMMEFTPLKIYPYYQPIHRLPRFLSIINIPTVLIIAYFLRCLFRESFLNKAVPAAIIAMLVVTSIHQSYRTSYFYNDCLKDARAAYAIIKNMDYSEIATDQEMKNYLLFFSGYKHRSKIKSFEFDHPKFPEKSLVILGGARRPDMDPGYTLKYVESVLPRKDWVLVREIKGKPEVWRLSDLVIYKVER